MTLRFPAGFSASLTAAMRAGDTLLVMNSVE